MNSAIIQLKTALETLEREEKDEAFKAKAAAEYREALAILDKYLPTRGTTLVLVESH